MESQRTCAHFGCPIERSHDADCSRYVELFRGDEGLRGAECSSEKQRLAAGLEAQKKVETSMYDFHMQFNKFFFFNINQSLPLKG